MTTIPPNKHRKYKIAKLLASFGKEWGDKNFPSNQLSFPEADVLIHMENFVLQSCKESRKQCMFTIPQLKEYVQELYTELRPSKPNISRESTITLLKELGYRYWNNTTN